MKYIIPCPHCKAELDFSEQLTIWKKEFIIKLDKLVEDLKTQTK